MKDNIITYDYFTPDNKIDNETINEIYKIIVYNENKISKEENDTKSNFDAFKNTLLNTPNYYIIVCKLNNEVIAFLSYCYMHLGLLISEVQIKEEYQGKNVLSKLLNEFITKIDKNKYNKINAFINSKHIKSKIVFTHIGFINTNNNHYEITYDKLDSYIKKKTKV